MKNPALKRINTHSKIATQWVAPDSDVWELQKDIYKKLG